MTTYINQTIARQHVADLVAAAEHGRLRRELRQARRAARAARRNGRGPSAGSSTGPSADAVRRPQEVGIAC
jgi:hypothetical protein